MPVNKPPPPLPEVLAPPPPATTRYSTEGVAKEMPQDFSTNARSCCRFVNIPCAIVYVLKSYCSTGIEYINSIS
jgi:hypothetical protein